MPKVILARTSNSSVETPIHVGTYSGGATASLRRGSYRAEIEGISSEHIHEMLANAEDLRRRGVLVYQVDFEDTNGDSVRILSGCDLSDGTTPSTPSAYKMDVTAGQYKVGNSRWSFDGLVDADPLALGVDKVGDSMNGSVLANGYAIKCRFYAVRLYTLSSDAESFTIVPVFGDTALDADIAALGEESDFPTDQEVRNAFYALQTASDGTLTYVDWREIGRGRYDLDSAGVVLTQEFSSLKDQDTMSAGLVPLQLRFTKEDMPAATSLTIGGKKLGKGYLFMGACLSSDTIPTAGVGSLLVKFGTLSDDDGYFPDFETFGQAAGPQATVAGAITAGSAQVNESPQVTITGDANLDTIDDLDMTVTLFYIPISKGGIANNGVATRSLLEGEF